MADAFHHVTIFVLFLIVKDFLFLNSRIKTHRNLDRAELHSIINTPHKHYANVISYYEHSI